MTKKNILKDIDMHALGKELRKARNGCGMTQEETAGIIGVARTTFVDIEKGKRRVKPKELIQLARTFGREVSDLINLHPNIQPFDEIQFRRPYEPANKAKKGFQKSVALFENLSLKYFELEQLNKLSIIRNYPPVYPILGSLNHAAERIAHAERNRLGLGDNPIPFLRNTLEQSVGLRIFYIEIKSDNCSGMYCYDDTIGACIAINILHPEERRRWTLAHEYGHFLIDRNKPNVNYWQTAYTERFVDYFARYFLMPTNGLMKQFNDIKDSQGQVTVSDLLKIAHNYGVSFQALLYRLKNMKLLSNSKCDKWQRGIKVRQAQQKLGLAPIPMHSEKLPTYYSQLALQAYNNDLISEAQLAKFLQIDLIKTRHIIQKFQRNGYNQNLGV